jgi:hypothetical protein
MIVGVDCVIGCKSCISGYANPSADNIVNCCHQHRAVDSTVMFKYEENCLIVARLGYKCGRRNAV